MNRPEPKTAFPADRSTPVHDGLPNPQRMLAFATLAMATAMAVLDGAIVNVALPTIAHELVIPNAELRLDRQRLPARGHGLAPAAVGARRQLRLSSRLSARPRALHAGVSCLRPRPDLFRADGRARRPGARRGGDHERQHRPRPLHLSVVPAWPRRRQHRAGRGRVLGREPDRGGGDPLGRLVAMALSHQRADRRGRARDGGAQPAGHPGLKRSLDPTSVILNALTFGLFITGVNGVGDREGRRRRSPSSSRPQRSAPCSSVGS